MLKEELADHEEIARAAEARFAEHYNEIEVRFRRNFGLRNSYVQKMAREIVSLQDQIFDLKRDVREAGIEKLRLEAEIETLSEAVTDQKTLVSHLKEQVATLEEKVSPLVFYI